MALRLRALSLSATVVLVLTACGGGGGSTSVAPATSGAKAVGPAAIQLFIPSAAISHARRAKALPSTTQSVQINVTSSTTTPLASPVPAAVFNVTAGTGGCQTVTGGISCTETMTVPFSASLLFSIVAFSGPDATGAAIAEGSTTASVSTATQNVAVTMNTESIYMGTTLDGRIGQFTIDHSANTFSATSSGFATSGTVASLLNGDLKLVVQSSTDTSNSVGDIVYAREIAGSVMLFGDTGSTSIQSTGAALAGNGDLGAAAGLQGCPTAGSSVDVSIAVVAGPGWTAAGTNAPSYINGTAAITVNSGVATLAFTGNDYNYSETAVQADGGSQTCSNGVYSAANEGGVAISPDDIIVVSDGRQSISPTDTKNGGYGFSETATPSLAPVEAATYDGFYGGFSPGSTSNKSMTPLQMTPVTPGTMSACQYADFEGNTPGSTTCTTIQFLSAAPQPGVESVLVTPPSQSPIPGIAVIGTTSSGKYVIFGTAGGTDFEFLQH